MLRLTLIFSLLLSTPTFAWTCKELLHALSQVEEAGLVLQELISRALGGDGTGFCGTACLVNYEKLLVKLAGSSSAVDPIARANLIAKELGERFSELPPGGMSPIALHHFVGKINMETTGTHAQPVTRTHSRKKVRNILDDNFQEVSKLPAAHVLGVSPSSVKISVTAIHFMGKNNEILGGHGVLLVPVDIAQKRVRVIDSRLPDMVFYATLVDDLILGVPRLHFENSSYKNQYNEYLTQWRESRGLGTGQVDIGEIVVTSAITVSENGD